MIAYHQDHIHTNLTLDFGLFDPALGNYGWEDTNQDGIQNEVDTGIDGVRINLYEDSNGNQVLDADDTYVKSTTTDAGGYYFFGFLETKDYIVQVAPGNFEVGGRLAGYFSSPGESDPDNDDNTDDNGILDYQGGYSARAVTLTSGDEPTDDGDDSEFTNLTVDFGFIRTPTSLDEVDQPDNSHKMYLPYTSAFAQEQSSHAGPAAGKGNNIFLPFALK
jgi:hypothetical protein